VEGISTLPRDAPPAPLCYGRLMQRLFVALRPLPLVRSWLLGLMGGVRGARWQRDDQLHLTLRFIGEVDRHMARDVDAALAAIRHPPFEVTLATLGLFDRRGRPEALWIGARPREPLAALHRKIDQALVGCGLAPERRAYLPHVTLARFGRESGPLGPFMEEQGGATSPPFSADAFLLFESRLGADGSAYVELARYALG
jgi:2'-5' RNA ligase